MNYPKNVLNAFTASEIRKITGLSIHMIDYLAREGYLVPTYNQDRVRGRVRYYSYRDLVIAEIVQRLRLAGVELVCLKDALQELKKDAAWFKKNGSSRKTEPIQWLVSDGKKVRLKHDDGFLDELRPGGQRSFAFVVSMKNAQQQVHDRLSRSKQEHFSVENRELIYELDQRKRMVRARG